MDLVGLSVRTGHFRLHFFDVRTEFSNFSACGSVQRAHMIFASLFFIRQKRRANGTTVKCLLMGKLLVLAEWKCMMSTYSTCKAAMR